MPMEKIVVGRGREDMKKYGEQGTVYIGKHIVGEGEESHLTNPVFMDVVRPHVVLISGKRGSGKSYSGCVMAEIAKCLASLITSQEIGFRSKGCSRFGMGIMAGAACDRAV